MVEVDKTVQFISKLVQLTQDKKIEWQQTSSPGVGPAFTAKVEGRRLGLYKYSEEIPNPAYDAVVSPLGANTLSSIFLSTGRGIPNKMILNQGTVLEVFGDDGNVIYKFDNKTGLSDLYESASYSAGRVDDLIDSVLKKK